MISLNNNSASKRLMILSIVSMVALSSFFSCQKQTRLTITDLPLLPLGGEKEGKYLGVSAPFCAIYKGYLWIGGGCNFPNIPAAKGGQKKFYNQLWRRPVNDFDAPWELFGVLPLPLAYGAAIVADDGIIFIGGENENGFSNKVFKLTLDKNIGIWSDLASLPEGMSNFTATRGESRLYIIGGNTLSGASKRMYCYSLTKDRWMRERDFPGIGRIQPTSCYWSGKESSKIFVLGGFENKGTQAPSSIAQEILSFDPETKQWRIEKNSMTLETKTYTPTGGTALSFNQEILLIGGVNHQRFEEAINRPYQIELAKKDCNQITLDSLLDSQKEYLFHPIDWYQFNSSIVKFVPQNKSLKTLKSSEYFARAGAGIALSGDTLFIVGGELKPGIRTPKGTVLIF